MWLLVCLCKAHLSGVSCLLAAWLSFLHSYVAQKFWLIFCMLGAISFFFSNQLSRIIKYCKKNSYVNQLMELSKYISSDFFPSGQDCIWIIGTAPHSLSRDISAYTAEVSLCFNWLSLSTESEKFWVRGSKWFLARKK